MQVTLTDTGEALRNASANVPERLTCARGRDDDEQTQLLDALRRLTASISATRV